MDAMQDFMLVNQLLCKLSDAVLHLMGEQDTDPERWDSIISVSTVLGKK